MNNASYRAAFNPGLGFNAGPELAPKAVPNPNQQAIALAYESGDYAPRVVAKGRGLIAERIIARAREHNVFVHESRDMVALLMQVDLDDHIPPALYQAIAEILAWLYRLEEGKADEVDITF
ncbi:MAG: EscU/YscU/HrcU family type III secretion system export apparatus switch protein [Methylophilaceae bacterium]